MSGVFRDTAGQERFRTITTAYYRGAMVGILTCWQTNVTFPGSHGCWALLISTHLLFFTGHHACLRHHQREVFWKYQELDQEHWGGILGHPLWACYVLDYPNGTTWRIVFIKFLFSWSSTRHRMLRKWSLGTSVTSTTSGRCPKTGGRRWEF